MTKGRPPDPKRTKRGTGNRPPQGTPKVVKANPVAVKASVKAPVKAPVESAAMQAFPIPADLPAVVHPVWRAVIEDLGGANHMRDSYLPSVRAYCEAVYLHAEASANIHEFGILVKGPNGPMANPLIRVQKDAAATMLRLGESLGLTPSGRIRLGLMEITGMSILSTLNESLDGKR